jgi:polyphosphate kinase
MADLIDREIGHVSNGRPGHLIFKMNSLVDPAMISRLYDASSAGVEVDLIVRGICCLRPGVPGLSEKIRVRSIVGRFLEHSRIYFFNNGGAHEVYLGSADLMPRNIDRRVEVTFPVEDRALVRHLRKAVLAAYMRDNVNAWQLASDGSYSRVQSGPDTPAFDAHQHFMDARAPAIDSTQIRATAS